MISFLNHDATILLYLKHTYTAEKHEYKVDLQKNISNLKLMKIFFYSNSSFQMSDLNES